MLFSLPGIAAYLDRVRMLLEVSHRVERLVLVVPQVDYDLPLDEYPDFDVVEVGYARGIKPINFLRTNRRAVRLIRDGEFNVIHDTFGDMLYVLRWARSRSVVTCSSVYWYPARRLRRLTEMSGRSGIWKFGRNRARIWYGAWVQKRIARYADVVVLQSKHLAPYLLHGIGEERVRIEVLPNNVDTTWWRPEEEGYGRRDRATEEVRLLFVGRIAESRGARVLARLLAELRNRGTKASLTVAGTGYDERMSDAVRAVGVEDRVRVAGSLGRAGVRQAFWTHDLLLYQTIDDGSPRVVLEAMATGLPVIASNHPGITCLDPDGEALVYTQYGAVDRIADLVEDARDRPDRWEGRGRRGREIALRHFSTPVIADRYSEFYRRLLYDEEMISSGSR